MNSKAQSYDFLGGETGIPRGNVTGRVAELLREAILTLQMRPGDAIDKNQVCKRLGISRFPVSEALTRLQLEGLVEIRPQRGSRVSLIRIADVREFMLIRRALEVEAVHILASDPPAGVVGELDRMIAAQREIFETDQNRRFHELDLDFHEIVVHALRFERLQTILDNARANIDRARRLLHTPTRNKDTLSEHCAILEAIRAGNPDAAGGAMRTHLDAVMSNLIGFARAQPHLFADGATEFTGRP